MAHDAIPSSGESCQPAPPGVAFPVELRRYAVGARTLRLWVSDVDHHLDALIARGGDDRDIPYWADVWPSAVAVAQHLLAHPEAVGGMRVLELGAGLGMAGVAAVLAGAAHVTAADLMPDALELAEANARLNAVPAERHRTARFDWRCDAPPAGTQLLLAADILYDRAELPHIRGLLTQRLPAGCSFLVAEPSRPVASDFFDHPDFASWRLEVTHLEGEAGGARQRIRLVHGTRGAAHGGTFPGGASEA